MFYIAEKDPTNISLYKFRKTLVETRVKRKKHVITTEINLSNK